MNTNDYEKELTGYPSIDKPWLKYYSEEAINAPLPESTIYEYLWENNRDHLDDVALVYFGRKITYGKLFENIDKAARAFSAVGIKEGDIVTGIAPCVPEIIYSFYALNRIGAVSNWLDPRMDLGNISKDLKNTETKILLILNDFYNKYKTIINEDLYTVIFSVKDSLPLIPKTVIAIKDKAPKATSNLIRYIDFVKKYNAYDFNDCSYKANRLALMEHTGGTTGIPKAVMLSNENVNAVVEQYRCGESPFSRNHSWLSIAFPFTAYSMICSHHLPLSLGMKCHLCFDTDTNKISQQIFRYHTNHMANTPVVWEHLINSCKADKLDFSFLICPTVGADTLDVEKEKKINAFLRSHGCKYNIAKGYGMTEVGSAVSFCINNECNKLGSVGVPFPKTVISVFDMETQKELLYDEQGEICISGPSVMLGYFNNTEETNKVLKIHSDGTVWLHSGDFGHIDKDGFLFIDGRIKRMIINHHGLKIFAPTIEKVIQQVNGVYKCCVVGVKDANYNVGQVPAVFLILEKNTDKNLVIANVKLACKKGLPAYYMTEKFIFVDEFPYTSAAKVDYRSLEEMANL
ncbi:MAG: acyl--CoA ligase [Butyrivibrio sp.]|nr:acyl--CoA ligase [Butyrivibrio sp.]